MKVKRKKLVRLLGAVVDAIGNSHHYQTEKGYLIQEADFHALTIAYQSFTTDKCGCGAEKK